MRMAVIIPGIALLLSSAVWADEADIDRQSDEQVLRGAGLAADGPALLEFFRKRTLKADERARIRDLIRKLGDEDFAARERAVAELIGMGVSAVPALRQAEKEGDAEISSRCRVCLQKLPVTAGIDTVLSALRVLSQRPPAGASDVLLDYLPDAADEYVQEEIVKLLVRLADGKPERALREARQDALAVRRAAAARCLAASKVAEDRPLARRLLEDEDSAVRWEAARALVRAGDRSAVPTLLALLTDASPPIALQADELLRQIAATATPALGFNSTRTEARRQARKVWNEWWLGQQERLDLNKQGPGRLGLTVICESSGDGNNLVWECGTEGKPRWQLKARNPIAVEPLPGGRFLIADSCGGEGQVAEYDCQGKVHWSRKVHWPVTCQRLPDGNTFIATQTELLEVTRGGRTVFSLHTPKFIFAARRLADGHIVYLHSSGQVVEIDADGQQVRVLAVGGIRGWGGLDVLENGNCLVAQYSGNRVVEFDAIGKVLWEVEVQTPSWVSGLPGGNVLVTSADRRRVFEFDRKGQKVWEQSTEDRAFCARRR